MNVTDTVTERRFPPPWSVEEGETYFVVKDNDGQQLAYVYLCRQSFNRLMAAKVAGPSPRPFAPQII